LRPDSCEIWTGTQFETVDRANAAQVAGLPPEKVQIHTTLLSGGFGRRANPASDFVVEAVHVAKIAKAPVKVVWTREDDLAGGWYRPMWHDRFVAGLDAAGNPTAWTHTIVGQSIAQGTPFAQYMINKEGVDSTSVEKDGTVRVHRVVCAVDCGRVVNPDIVKAQMEGGIIFGLTAALKTEITLENGRVQQKNFHDYQMLRMFESPEIEVHIVHSELNPTGVGEPT